jgi:hypothetical protein
VENELARDGSLLGQRVRDELLGEGGDLARGRHPAGGVAAEGFEDHAEVIKVPLRRTQQLGDVPAPELVG